MANVKWDKLEVGDFFTANINMGQDTLLYQKINTPGMLHNTILLNSGEICNLYIGPETTFEKVEVTFSIKPTE
jgi:hypothetical protein